jgi:hypothetical protein
MRNLFVDSTFSADLLADGVFLPSGQFHDLGQRRTLGALHQGDDLGLLVAPRFIGALGRPDAPGGLRGGLLRLPLGRRGGPACGATSGDRRWIAPQIRVTADFLLVNFFTGFRSSNGATPAKLFQVSIRREASHSAASFARSFSVANVSRFSVLAGEPVCTAMLLSESIVNVAMMFLVAACCGR